MKDLTRVVASRNKNKLSFLLEFLQFGGGFPKSE